MPERHQQPLISISQLCRSFDEGTRRRDVLTGLDLEVAAGESVALTGRSGSGKSTLLNLISGIDLPDAGSIHIGGRDVTRLSETERTLYRRRNIGFVYQSFNLVPTLSVGDNIRLVLELNGLGRRAASERVAALLRDVGLDDRTDSFPDILSGGEQQRVAIARALAHEPPLLLADEPTGNLDDDNARLTMSLLRGMADARGTTMIIATHSRSIAAGCDRVLHLVGGTVGN